MAVRVFTDKQVIEALTSALLPHTSRYKAFYNSRLEAVTFNPALMLVPMDDHMVHRGHAVFDTLLIVEGRAVHLDLHVQRLVNSALGARIELPMEQGQLREKILHTVACTGLENCKVRYWISAGPGSFGVSPIQGMSTFYVVVSDEDPRVKPKPLKEFTSKIPCKDSIVATIKSTNYLVNVLVCMESQEKGGAYGIQLDDNECISEGSACNICFIMPGKVLVTAPFGGILSGITVARVLAFADKLIERGILNKIEIRSVHKEEARNCEEMMLTSGESIKPVIEWDGHTIGNGQTGEVTQLIADEIYSELFDESLSVPVPYQLY